MSRRPKVLARLLALALGLAVSTAEAAITIVDSSITNAAAALSIAVPKPPSCCVTGDRLYFFISTNGDSLPVLTDANGGTPTTKHPSAPWRSTSPANSSQLDIFYRDAGGSEPATFTFNKSTSERGNIVVIQVRGMDAVPFEVSPVLGNSYPNPSATSLVSPGATTLSNNALIIAVVVADGGSFIPSAIGGMTLLCSCGGNENVAIGYAIQAAAGASGSKTWTVNAGQYFTMAVGSIAEAVTGAATQMLIGVGR